MEEKETPILNTIAKENGFKFSWDGGAAALGLLLMATYAGVRIGVELIRADAAVKVAEVQTRG